ncbi:MAG: hypothetical protein M1830_001307 [Pleopsidium flavum]|nr:MAG: hypothetical protein M1830_001307 [Pleopsidium flavum]
MGTPEQAVQAYASSILSSSQDGAPCTEQPAPPRPSRDTGIKPSTLSPLCDDGVIPDDEEIDIFTLTPVAALKLLCSSVESLVRMTGDVPPTPPVSYPTAPNLKTIQAEKEEVVRKLVNWQGRPQTPPSRSASDEIDGVPFKKTPIGSPEAGAYEPFHIIGANSEPINIQHSAIVRKFYSKKPPPIALEEYLLRLHRYCPMSTAVYLATSFYIHKLAVIEDIIPVTGRNVHRLVLAGLRVAMKALEDLSYPHRRFAKVGGVSEPELGRLEVSFCFLTNFELKVDKEMLWRQATAMRDGESLYEVPETHDPSFPPMRDGTKTPTRYIVPSRPMLVPTSS